MFLGCFLNRNCRIIEQIFNQNDQSHMAIFRIVNKLLEKLLVGVTFDILLQVLQDISKWSQSLKKFLLWAFFFGFRLRVADHLVYVVCAECTGFFFVMLNEYTQVKSSANKLTSINTVCDSEITDSNLT